MTWIAAFIGCVFGANWAIETFGLVPVGFGHGFAVLSEQADVSYQLSSLYDPATESGIAWDDPGVGIEWPVDEPLLSDRDRAAPRLSEVADSLPF